MLDCLIDLVNDPNRVKAITSFVDFFLKLVLGIIGLYLAHSIGRHIALRISEKRLKAYSALWAVTKDASPTRLIDNGEGPLTSEQRKALHDKLQNWYYESGNGMILAESTRLCS